MTASEIHKAVDPGLQFCSTVWEVREVTHKANPLHMLGAYRVLAFYEILRNKPGIAFAAAKTGILKLIYEQSQCPAGA